MIENKLFFKILLEGAGGDAVIQPKFKGDMVFWYKWINFDVSDMEKYP